MGVDSFRQNYVKQLTGDSFPQGLTCPKSELRMVRKLMSDAEEAALDLRERRDDLLDSGTREHEDGDALVT